MLTQKSDEPPTGLARAAEFIVAGALFGVALTARLYELGTKPLWLDEVLTKHRAALTLPNLIVNSVENNHTPLFFLLEHAVISLVPGSVGLRLLPAVAGAVSAPLVFGVGRAAGLRTGALLGGLFAALSPLQVAFGQEARSYTLMLSLILVALWGLLRLAPHSRGALPRPERVETHAAWLAYGLGTVGALLTLGDAWLWFAVANFAVAVAILPNLIKPRLFLAPWLMLQGFIVLVAAPVYVAILLARGGHAVDSFLWIPPLTGKFVWADVASLYGLNDATMVSMKLLAGPVPYLTAVTLLLPAIGFASLHRHRICGLVLLIAGIGPGLILALISFAHPVLLPRYLLWSAAPFFVLAGAAIEALPGNWRPSALLIAGIVLAFNLLPYYRTETKPRWDLAAASLASRLRPHDVVLMADGAGSIMLNTYLKKEAPTLTLPAATTQPSKARLAFVNSGSVWAIYGRAGQGKLPSRSLFFGSAQSLGVPRLTERIGREITIEKIDAPGSIDRSRGPTARGRTKPSAAASGGLPQPDRSDL